MDTHLVNQAKPLEPRAGSATAWGEETRDLGFGSVVASEARQRLLNRDGTFNAARTGLSFFESLSLYHSLLVMKWTKFLAIVVIFYLAANSSFAVAYLLCGPEGLDGGSTGGVGNGFLRAFFFSVETFSTIGYGHISPANIPANVVVAVEALFGLLMFALATGLLFARFSRPTAKILFSRNAIIAPYRDFTAFEFRITNARSNQMFDVKAKVLFARFEDVGGRSIRRFYPLSLEREEVQFFPLSWTIVHPIDESSPLSGYSEQQLRDADGEFLVLLTGIDETFSQTVHARSSYKADEIVWHAKFANIFNPRVGNEPITIDVARLDSFERV